MDEIGGNSVGKFPGNFRIEFKKKLVPRTQEQASLGPALAQPSLAQAGTRPKPAQAWAQIRPDHMNPTYFQKSVYHGLKLKQASELRSGHPNTAQLCESLIRD